MGVNVALKDRARVVVTEGTNTHTEGRTSTLEIPGTWFRARLTQQTTQKRITRGATSDAAGTPRTLQRPTLLFGVHDSDGQSLIAADGGCIIRARDRIEVQSAQLGNGIYELTGDPRPIRAKRRIKAFQANMVRVLFEVAPRPEVPLADVKLWSDDFSTDSSAGYVFDAASAALSIAAQGNHSEAMLDAPGEHLMVSPAGVSASGDTKVTVRSQMDGINALVGVAVYSSGADLFTAGDKLYASVKQTSTDMVVKLASVQNSGLAPGLVVRNTVTVPGAPIFGPLWIVVDALGPTVAVSVYTEDPKPDSTAIAQASHTFLAGEFPSAAVPSGGGIWLEALNGASRVWLDEWSATT